MTTTALSAEEYRGELLGFCYRFFGCYAEAEDAVQETMLRAWQRSGGFEGGSSVRTWLYRIATNICLDMRKAPQRRALPVALGPPGVAPNGPFTEEPAAGETWVGPIADSLLSGDPAETAVRRDTVRLAFVAALQLLPARQRVVLILRDVLAWSAAECADLLDTSETSVHSALARARRTMAASDAAQHAVEPDRDVLRRYVAAFEDYDVDRLVALLAEDAAFSMPPFAFWMRGADDIERWWLGPGTICRGSRTLITRANGQDAVAVYHPVAAGRWEPFAVHLLDTAAGRITAITHFLGAQVFDELGLPSEVVDESSAKSDDSADAASSIPTTDQSGAVAPAPRRQR